VAFREWIVGLCNSCGHVGCLNACKNSSLAAKTLFTISQVSFSGCVPRSIHLLICAVEYFVPPADLIEFWEDETLFAFDMVVDFASVVFRIGEFSSKIWAQ
jgi:hypothetical protein